MLPKELFENKSGEEQVATESDIFYLVEKVTYDNGIQTWLKGAEYYQKGQAPAQTLYFLNMAKRIMSETLKLTSKLPVVVGFLLGQVLLPKKHKLSTTTILATYNSILWKVISPYILNKQYMMPFSREIRQFIYNFVKEIGIDELNATQFSAIVSHFFEYDNAYRYRVQDLVSETTKQDFISAPQKVIQKFIALSKERDVEGVSEKVVGGLKLLSWALRIPRYKKAFINALTLSDFKNFQYDEIDIYWISMRNDYLYMGEDVETRSKRNEGKKIPAPMPKPEYEAYINKLHNENNEVLILKSIDALLKNKKWLKIIKSKLKQC